MKKTIKILFFMALILSFCASAHAESTVIADDDNIYVEITEFSYEDISNEYVLEFLVENRSGRPIEFGTNYACVNGYVVDSYMFDTLAAQRRSISYLEIIADDVKSLDLETIDELIFSFYVNDTSYYSETQILPHLFSETITYYPSGEKPTEIVSKELSSFYSEYEFANDFIDMVIYDAKTLDTPFYEICCAIENPNDFDISVSCSDFKADGQETEPYWLCRIPAGKKILTSIFVDEESLPPEDFFEVDHISFNLQVYNGWLNLYGEEETAKPFFAYPISFYPAKG